MPTHKKIHMLLPHPAHPQPTHMQALESSQAAEASLRLPDFDYEARRTAARSTTAGGGGGTGENEAIDT